MTTHAAPLRRPIPSRPFHVVIGPGSRRSRAGYWVLLGIVAAAAFLLSVYARIALDRAAFVLTDLESQITTAESEHWELRLELSRLQSPERIAQRASELGMVYPEAVRSIVIPGLGAPGSETEDRLVDLKGLLSAQP